MARAEFPDGDLDDSGGGPSTAPAPRISATVADCNGCIGAHRHQMLGGCWLFPNARIVEKARTVLPKGYRGRLEDLPRASFIQVSVPQCYSRKGFLHLDAVPEGAK